MKKLPHKFLFEVYSDNDLDTLLSSYKKKYNMTCIIDFGDFKILRHVNYSNKKDTFNNLRKLVRLKHECVKNGGRDCKRLNEKLTGIQQ